MTSITIVAGGFSAKAFDLKKLPGTIIAVNDAAYHLARWDLCVSMDRLWHENRYRMIQTCNKPVWLRINAVKSRDIATLPNVTLFECDYQSTTLSDEPGRLNGTNSGLCALNLAYQMKPETIYLLGFDMQLGPRGERHWYPDYAWNPKATGTMRLAEWSSQFKKPAEQLRAAGIRVFLAGRSAIDDWESISRTDLESACVN